MHIILWLAHTPQNTRAHTPVCVCVHVCELCKNILKLRRRWLQPPFAIVVCLVLCSWPDGVCPCSFHTCSTFICHSFMHIAWPPLPSHRWLSRLASSRLPPTWLQQLGDFYHSPLQPLLLPPLLAGSGSVCHFVYYYDLFWILFYLSYIKSKMFMTQLPKLKKYLKLLCIENT